MDFFKRHILGMMIFAILTGVFATFLYDYFDIKPKRTFFDSEDVQVAEQEKQLAKPLVSDPTSQLPSVPPAFASTSRLLKEWDDCVTLAESTVSQQKVGVSGVEAAIHERCGERPIIEPDTLVDATPYDLVRSKTWSPKFRSILGGSYDAFVERIVVSSSTELEGEWVVASGCRPHNCGDEEAAFAINKGTGTVFAAMLEDGRHLTGFGFGPSWNAAPPFLQRWTVEMKHRIPIAIEVRQSKDGFLN